MDQVIEENSQLRSQVEANMQARSQLTSELEDLRGKYQAMASLNSNMEAEVQALRQSLQVRRISVPLPFPSLFLPYPGWSGCPQVVRVLVLRRRSQVAVSGF